MWGPEPHRRILGVQISTTAADQWTRLLLVGIELLVLAAVVAWTTRLGDLAPAMRQLLRPFRVRAAAGRRADGRDGVVRAVLPVARRGVAHPARGPPPPARAARGRVPRHDARAHRPARRGDDRVPAPEPGDGRRDRGARRVRRGQRRREPPAVARRHRARPRSALCVASAWQYWGDDHSRTALRRTRRSLTVVTVGAIALAVPSVASPAYAVNAIQPANRPTPIAGQRNGLVAPGALLTVEGDCRLARDAAPSFVHLLAAARGGRHQSRHRVVLPAARRSDRGARQRVRQRQLRVRGHDQPAPRPSAPRTTVGERRSTSRSTATG